MKLYAFQYYCAEMNKRIVQVNFFDCLDSASDYAAGCGTNSKAAIFDGDDSVYETGII